MSQVYTFQQKCLFVTFRRKLHTKAWAVEDNDISNGCSVCVCVCVCVCVVVCQKNTKRNPELVRVWSLGERDKETQLLFAALVEPGRYPGVSTWPPASCR